MTLKKHRRARKWVIDEATLGEALLTVRSRFPAATHIVLVVSDHASQGFWLRDVLDGSGDSLLAKLDQDDRCRLSDELACYLDNLDRDGVVGEDGSGSATLPLPRSGTDSAPGGERDA